MKEFLDKLSSYHFFNYLLPGVLFVILVGKFTNYNLYQSDIVLGLFLYYFIGLTISRVGSQVIEPFFKKIGIIVFGDYKEFISASKEDPKLETLSEVNNMYRTLCTLFIVLLGVKLYSFLESAYPMAGEWNPFILVVVFLILFAFSYKKQSSFIADRIKAHIKKGKQATTSKNNAE